MGLDIIIPTKGKTDYLFNCIDSIIKNTETTEYHIHVCDTGSDVNDLAKIKQFLKERFSETKNVSLHLFNYYNFAKINNHVIDEFTTHENLLLCNNDIKLINNAIDMMYEVLTTTENVGTVGCRLLFKNETVQHAGQMAFTHTPQGWYHLGTPKLEVTHRGLRSTREFKDQEEVMGNTAALMMIKRDVFYKIGGFVEDYKECFEDVHLNMECLILGYKNIYLDKAKAYHDESVTRTKSQQAMTRLEQDYHNNLYPFWNGLTDEMRNLITSYSKDEVRGVV